MRVILFLCQIDKKFPPEEDQIRHYGERKGKNFDWWNFLKFFNSKYKFPLERSSHDFKFNFSI